VYTFDLPDSAATQGQEATHYKELESFQHLRSKLFRQLVQEVTTSDFEAVCMSLAAPLPSRPCLSLFLSPAFPSVALTPRLSCLCCSASPPHSPFSRSACFPLFFPTLLPSCCLHPSSDPTPSSPSLPFPLHHFLVLPSATKFCQPTQQQPDRRCLPCLRPGPYSKARRGLLCRR
jgi:hypothetical protein